MNAMVLGASRVRKKICAAVLAIFVVVGSLFAQSGEAWYVNIPIEDISFDGLSNVSENDVMGVVEPYLGQLFTDDILLDIQRRLYNLEYFDLIIPEAVAIGGDESRLQLKFTVEERAVIDDVRIVGNQRLRRETILSEILLTSGDFVSRAQARLDQEAIISLYRERGYPSASASFSYEDNNDNTSDLVFTVNEGYQTNVQSISFDGINFATENKLRSLLETKEQSLFNSGTFQEVNLELDKQAILAYYGENGYIDAQVLDIRREIVLDEEKNRQFLELTYYIDEGRQWYFGGIDFEGNEIFSTEELRDTISLDNGDILNAPLLQQGLQAMSDTYYQGGYIFNQISIDEERDETLRQISYHVSIVEQGRAYIENIIIRGNTKTKDEVILRELPFEEGDVFSAAAIREGIANLYNTQYFATVPSVETPEGSVPGLMDLVISLEEGQTTDIRLGFSVGGGEGFPISGLVKWSDSNFRGNGQTISADLNISDDEQVLTLSYLDDWMFGERWSGGVTLTVDRAVDSDTLQDILSPTFDKNDANAVPDPYEGYFVFSEDTTYDGTDYDAGDPFPTVPTEDDIDEYDLVTDYIYAGGSSSIDDEYLMEYTSWYMGLSFSSGIRERTFLGWAGLTASISTGISYVNYDDELYRAYSYEVRENLGQVKFENSIGLKLSMDNRDVVFNPQNGYYVEQYFKYTGGLLGGAKNFIRSDSTLQYYHTLINTEVTDNYTYKLVLAVNSSMSLLLPQFFTYGDENFEAENRLLETNGMTIARGWDSLEDGQAIWNNWIELRMPIAEQILWFDLYFEGVRFVEDRSMIFDRGADNWYYGFGAGLRFSMAQFPFRLYFAKLFQVVDGDIEWQDGNLFNKEDGDGSGISLIFSISI